MPDVSRETSDIFHLMLVIMFHVKHNESKVLNRMGSQNIRHLHRTVA